MRLSCIALILCSLLLYACATAGTERIVTPENYEEAAALYRRGHELFIARLYDQALEAYNGVDRFIEKNPRFSDFFDHSYRGFSIADMVRRHRALGQGEPEIVHRVLVLYIDRTEAVFGDRLLSARFSEEMKETERISRQVCAMLLEVLSNGKLGLEFEELNLDAALTEIEPSDPRDSRFSADRGVESISPYPGELLASRVDDFDSFVFYWNHRDDTGEEIYKGPHGWGGVSRIPVIPYQSYGPPRGRILISAGLSKRPGTLLHELFHTFEKSMGIAPIHGFWDEHRHHFPAWKGEGELDYYQYHFSRLAEDPGYGNFLLSRRYPAGTLPEFLERKEIREAILPPAARLDPYCGETAYWLGVCHYNSGRADLALDSMERAMELNPSMKKARVYYEFVKSRAEASQ